MDLRLPLTTLLSAARDSVGALVLDEAGETVEWVSGSASEDDLSLLGAYLGLRLRRTGEALERLGAGRIRTLEQDRGRLRCHLRTLPHGYSLVLVQQRPGLSGEARLRMGIAASEISRRLFPEDADG